MKFAAICAGFGILLGVQGCCGGMVKTPEARKSFIDSFNEKQPAKGGCKLTSASSDHAKSDMNCADQPIEVVKMTVKAACAAYQLVGFESIALTGKDGTATCDIKTDCSCK